MGYGAGRYRRGDHSKWGGQVNAPILQRLFGAQIGTQFLANYWPERSTGDSGDALRYAEICDASVSALLEDIRACTEVWPKQSIEIFGNQLDEPAVPVTSDAALVAFREHGKSIRLRRFDQSHPIVGRWLKELVDALSVQTYVRRSYANLLISPAGWGCVPHVDGHEVFVLHLLGEKTWTYAPPDILLRPNAGYELGSQANPALQFELSREELPSRMPRRTKRVTLRQGGSFFLPRGYYHRTHGRAASMQITFSIEAYTRGDHVTQGLSRWVMRDPDWRAVATHMFRDGDVLCDGGMPDLLDRLQSHMRRLSSPRHRERFIGDMFEATAGPSVNRYWVNPFRRLSLQQRGAWLLTVRGGRRVQRLEVRADWAPLLQWLCSRRAPFSLADAEHAGQMAGSDVESVLLALNDEGIIWYAPLAGSGQ